MLFDLKGRRRRVVQATYLMLAVLMGGGLVFFGIGGDVSGGLFDAFSDRSSSGNSLVEDRIEENEDKVAAEPEEHRRRSRRSCATGTSSPTRRRTRRRGSYTDEGKERLAEADDGVAALPRGREEAGALARRRSWSQVYAPTALNKPAEAAEAAEIVAIADPTAQAYLQLAQYAAQAGQERKADLAGKKAIELAPKEQRNTGQGARRAGRSSPPPASTTPQPS